jgi:hypothetical protein
MRDERKKGNKKQVTEDKLELFFLHHQQHQKKLNEMIETS